MATNGRTVTVFGGTGFLGRRIVRHLRYREFPVRIASRHPDRGHSQFGPDDPQLQFLEANIQDERSVADALAGAYGVVNAVSLYIEHGLETSHSVHVESAQRVAAQAHRAGVDRLIHILGIGADPASQSQRVFHPPGCGEWRTSPAGMFGAPQWKRGGSHSMTAHSANWRQSTVANIRFAPEAVGSEQIFGQTRLRHSV